MSEKISIARAVILYTLLRDTVLGNMPINDKMRVINIMCELRKVANDFEEYKQHVIEKIPEDKGNERIEAFKLKANEDVEIASLDKISENSFALMMDANPGKTIEQLIELKDILC